MSSASSLSLYWLLYMAGMGLVFPFQALYFRENADLAGLQLGAVLAMRPLMGLVAQPLWGWVADRSGSRLAVLGAVTAGAALAYLLLPLAAGFGALLALMAFASLFTTAVIPLATSVTMAALGAEAERRFGPVRAWGTLGFLLLVAGFPFLLDSFQAGRGLVAGPDGPSEPGLGLAFVLAGVLSAVAAATTRRIPPGPGLTLTAARGDARKLLQHPPYRRLLLVTFLAYLFLQGPIQLFPVFVRAHGGSLDTVSLMWLPMLALEIPLLFAAGATLQRFGARGLLRIGILADGLRWTVCAWADHLGVIFAMQLLHGVVVAGLIVGAQLYVESVVPERLRSTGQAVMAMVGVSVGGIFSSVSAGWLLDRAGADAPALWGGGAALLLGLALPGLLPKPRRQVLEPDPSGTAA